MNVQICKTYIYTVLCLTSTTISQSCVHQKVLRIVLGSTNCTTSTNIHPILGSTSIPIKQSWVQPLQPPHNYTALGLTSNSIPKVLVPPALRQLNRKSLGLTSTHFGCAGIEPRTPSTTLGCKPVRYRCTISTHTCK